MSMADEPLTDKRLAQIEARIKYPCTPHLVYGCETNNPIIEHDAPQLLAEVRRLRTENADLQIELRELRKAVGISSPSEELRNHMEGKPSVWDKEGAR